MELFTNSECKELAQKMQVYQDLYDGDHAVLTNSEYLIRHFLEEKSEGDELINRRIKLTRYRNYMEPIISAFVAMAFKKGIDTSEVSDIFPEDVLANIDGQNSSLENFIKNKVARDYFLLGHCYILTDAPPNPMRPYWVSLSPISVKDYATKSFSTDLQALRYEYFEATTRTNLEEKEQVLLKSKQYYLQDNSVIVQEYVRKDVNGTFEKGNVYQLPFQELPIARIVNNKSWVHDACEEARRYLNLLSMRDNVLNHQGYQRSYIAGDIDEKQIKLVNEYVTGVLPSGAQIFTVDAASTDSIEKALEQSQAAIFQIAFNMQRILPFDSKGIQGEGTIAENKRELRDLIVEAVKEIEDVVNAAVKHFALFMNKPNYEGKIKIAKDITVDDIDSILRTLPVSKPYYEKVPAWKKAIIKKLAKSMQLEEEKEILNEIEGTDFKEEPIGSGLDLISRG